MCGLHGQQTVCDSNLVWVTKTHYPLNVYKNEEVFNAQKMIVIVRNPIDIIPSVASLFLSKSHSFEFENKLHEEFPEWWDGWVTAFCENINTGKEYVITHIAQQIPTYVLRYEDLKLNPKPVLEEMFCFLLDVESIEGTVVQ